MIHSRFIVELVETWNLVSADCFFSNCVYVVWDEDFVEEGRFSEESLVLVRRGRDEGFLSEGI